MSQAAPLIVTEVHLTWIQPVGGLIALARVVLNDALVLDSIGVHAKLSGGYRLTYPNKNGRAVFHPIAQAASRAIETAIYDAVCKNTQVVKDDRYCGADLEARAIPHP